MRHHITRATRHLIFWSLVVTAIVLTGVRLTLQGIHSYEARIETRIEEIVGAPVKLGGLGANMRGVSPELILKNINIASTSAAASTSPAIQLKEIRLGINLGDYLLTRDLLASAWVTLVGAKLSIIRNPDGQFAVEGLKAGGSDPLWLLQGRQYQLLQSQITFEDQLQKVAPLMLDEVNLAVMNDGERHQVNLITKLSEKYGNDLKMIVDFEGPIDKLQEIKGKLYFEGNNLKLHKLISPYLLSDISVSAGNMDIKAWGQWQGDQQLSFKTETRINQAVLAKKGQGTFSISQLDSQINGKKENNQWVVDINRFILESSENGKTIKWPDAIASIAGETVVATGVQSWKLFAKQLDLAETSQLMHFFAPLSKEQGQLLNQAKAAGTLRDFSLYAEPDKKSFAVAGNFESISVEPQLSMPGVKSISGQVKGSDLRGAVSVSGLDVSLNLPLLFEKSLVLNKVNGTLEWRQSESDWELSSPLVELDCSAFKSESRLKMNIPKVDKDLFIDLQTSLISEDMSQIKTYLPTKILNPTLKNWLERAFVAGKITKGDVLIYGSPKDLPFSNGSGVLQAMFDVDNFELNFNPEWPQLSVDKGKLDFEQNDFIANLHSGKMAKVDIKKAQCQIPRLGSNDEKLLIKGEAQGDVSNVLNLLQQSPLVNKIAPVTKATTAHGAAKGNIDLIIPLWPHQELKADGDVQLNNAQLTVNQLDLAVSKIYGPLKFNKEGIYSDGIQANALGKPIKIKLDQGNRSTFINVAGNTSVAEIDKLFGWSRLKIVEGQADYQLQLTLPNSEGDDPASIDVKSTLEGVALTLPGNLSKSKAQKRPTLITIGLTNDSVLPIELDYDNKLKAAIKLNTKGQIINSGHVVIGDGNAKQTKVPGIKLEINQEPLALQDWLGLTASKPSDTATVNVNEVKVHSQAAFLNKTRIGLFDLDLKRNSNFWSGEINSAIAKGRIQYPFETTGAKPITMDMDMLNLTALINLKMQDSPGTTEFKPLLDIKSKMTLWKSKNFGQLLLETQRTPKGMKINRLELVGTDEKLIAKGNWQEIGQNSISHLNGRLEMNKADELFDKLNITKDLTDTSGAINFSLNWDNAPWQLSLPDLRGTMDVKLKNGRILSIEPGFGRVLGILAVAQWVKRLQLDFSDIYQEGLTFNSIEGHFDLRDGKATTRDLLIDAVPAKITITGDTDLINQTVDHEIKVVPKSLDAVPIAGTIVSRIAAMIGKTLTGKDQEGFFFGTQYLVKGKWDDVKISSQHENDGLFHKTWSSITDFPWEEQKK
jgi:uncharacterized protein (TIGR02099 family)